MDKDIGKLIEDKGKEYIKLQSQHIELLAAAYFRETDISPEDAVLVEQKEGTTIRWWFERKKISGNT